MDTTVCPWCHSEIVWDPEFGPEEHCPHCGNELQGYRTLNIELDEEDEQPSQYAAEEAYQQNVIGNEQAANTPIGNRAATLLDEAELFQQPNLSSLKTIEQYGDENFKMVDYEEKVEQLLDSQEEIPQCPHCQEYMLLAGSQEMGATGFKPNPAANGKLSFLTTPYTVNVYVCPSCFHVHQSLDEAGRLRMIDTLSRSTEQNG